MTLSNGRSYLAIPGPSVVPDRVLRAMHRASPNIYEGELIDMVPGLLRDLRAVARTRHHAAIYIANGHGAWEAALANTLGPGDRAVVLATGRFGADWGAMARAHGVETETIDFGKRAPADPERLARVLAEDTDHRIRAVLAVHVDTSTSVRTDIKALRDVLDDAGHPALLMADCIASLGCDVFEMDAWGVDVAVTGSQKGLMTPPGMAFVFFNDRALAATDRLERVSVYWDWRPRVAPAYFSQQFCGTAPTHHLYGLRAALDMIHAEGIEAVWARHATLARAVWAAVDVWGSDGPLRLNVADPAHRSHAVTTLNAGGPEGAALREWVEHRAGLTLGIGLGMADLDDPARHHFFRIGHMGHVNAQMIMGALGGIEAGMKAVGLGHADGGLSAAAAVLSAA